MNIGELLEDRGVEFQKQGKNVSRGWIGLKCPFCNDQSNHLGIRLSDLKCKCWKCGGKNLAETFQELFEIPYKTALNLISQLETDVTFDDNYEDEKISAERYFDGSIPKIDLPKESAIHFPKIHLDYLKKRGFGLKTIRKYRLKAVYTAGKYKFRIIIPIIFKGRIVSFTSRDVTDEAEAKYITAPIGLTNAKDFVYNIDSLKKGDNAILVEGPIDVWRLGDKAISFLGVSRSEKQLVQLYKKEIKTLHILYDNDETGKRNARRQAKELSPIVEQVNILWLEDKKDPGELSNEEAEILMAKVNSS